MSLVSFVVEVVINVVKDWVWFKRINYDVICNIFDIFSVVGLGFVVMSCKISLVGSVFGVEDEVGSEVLDESVVGEDVEEEEGFGEDGDEFDGGGEEFGGGGDGEFDGGYDDDNLDMDVEYGLEED